MRFRFLKNDRGLTLVELTVAMAITSILLVIMVSASLFVQRYLSNWHKRDDLAEELDLLSSELSRPIANARQIRIFSDSMRTVSVMEAVTTFDWHTGHLQKNGKSLTRSGLHIDSLSVSRKSLPKWGASTTLGQTDYQQVAGIYELFIRISSSRALSESLRVVVRNEYEFNKYKKD